MLVWHTIESIEYEFSMGTSKILPQVANIRGVGTGEAQGHMPSQYFEQLVPVPLQHFQRTSGPTKCVPLQYLTPSYAPDSTYLYSDALTIPV